jgi:hypothetical protein
MLGAESSDQAAAAALTRRHHSPNECFQNAFMPQRRRRRALLISPHVPAKACRLQPVSALSR